MGRKNRAYKKGDPFRDATLFVIVCEGAKREGAYFEALADNSKRIKVRIIPPENDKSSPEWLLNNASKAVDKEYQLGEGDQLWFVLDVDRWEKEQLHRLGKTCDENEKKWFCAISNPCFEVWLFMHYNDITKSASKSCQEFKAELHTLTKESYNKNIAVKFVDDAIKRAKAVDENPTHYMPTEKTTKVYQLVEALLEKKKNNQ